MIVCKSNTGGGVGLLGGKICLQWENTSKLERNPYDLYNIKFYVWECIIIIGVGWGSNGGVKAKNKLKTKSYAFSHNKYYVNYLAHVLLSV